MARYRVFSALLVVAASVPAVGHSGPLTQDPCPGTASKPIAFKALGNNVLENLLFAYGSLWVSDGTAGEVRRFDHEGFEGTGLSGVSSPGGLTVGPDGRIYAGVGNSLGNSITRNGAAKVVSFTQADPEGTDEVYADGFNMPNGMAWNGNDLFVSNDFDSGLIRIPGESPSDWELYSDVWGTNGLVVHGGSLYAAITFDQRSPIEKISLASGSEGSHETAVQLSLGVASLEPKLYGSPNTEAPLLGVKGLDDMTGDGEYLYPVANGTGELLRVNPATKAACLITGGLQNPSSVRIAPEGSPFSDLNPATIDFYITEFDGRIMRVLFAPA